MGNGRGGRKSFINIFFPLNAIVSTIFLFEITNNYFVPSSRNRGNFTCKDETLNTFLTVFKFWQKEKRTFNSKTFGSVLCSPLDKGRLFSSSFFFSQRYTRTEEKDASKVDTFSGTRSIRVGGKVSREKRIRTKGILLTRPYLRAYANAEQFATGICIDSGGDLYGIMSRHNLKTLCQLCTAFSSSHVSASSATPPFFLFLSLSSHLSKLFSRRWGIRRWQITWKYLFSRTKILARAKTYRWLFIVRGMRVTCLVVCIDRARHHTNSEYLLMYRIEISISYIYIYLHVWYMKGRNRNSRNARLRLIPQNYWWSRVSLKSALFITEIRTFRSRMLRNKRSFVRW